MGMVTVRTNKRTKGYDLIHSVYEGIDSNYEEIQCEQLERKGI